MLGRSEMFPAVVCQLHAAYLHSVGLTWALEFVQLLLRHDVFAGSYKLLVSRLDLYADFQGWVPVLEDLHRFVGYGRNRCGFEERNEAFTAGDRLTGLMFGRDALVARLYDKTQEIRRHVHRGTLLRLARALHEEKPLRELEILVDVDDAA